MPWNSSAAPYEGGSYSPGPFVKQLRLQRNMSQRTLAVRSGIDPSTISRLERGMSGTTLSVLNRLADGLGCTPEDLMSGTTPATRPDDSESLIDLQRALIGTALVDDIAPRQLTQPGVAERIETVRELRVAGQYRQAAAAAASCLPAAHAAAGRPHNRRQARMNLAHLCFDTALTARVLGDFGTSWIAAKRCQEVAVLTRQPTIKAASAFALAYVALGRTVPFRAVQIIESSLPLPDPITPETAALSGLLHLCAALALVRSRADVSRRERHLAEANALLPAMVGDTDPFAVHFNQDTYWQWRMNIALESRNTAAAAEALGNIRLDKITAPTRQAVYFIDLARLYVALGRVDSAGDLLMRAELLAREYVSHHHAARRLRQHLASRAQAAEAMRPTPISMVPPARSGSPR